MNEPRPALPIGELEIELGVPIPGPILPPDQWASTALKRLPEKGPIDFLNLFGRQASVVVEIGCGNGRYIISSAVRRPHVNHLGTDSLPLVIRYATRRGKERGLWNTRFAVCGGTELLERYVAPDSVSEIHVYHPQPYADDRDKQRRLLTPAFMVLVHRALSQGGKFFVQTDNLDYWTYLSSMVPQLMIWHEQPGIWEEDPLGRSRREIIARSKGLPIFRAWAQKNDELSVEQVQQMAAELQTPDFSVRLGKDKKKGSSNSRRKVERK